jgi:hypothetical protein
VDGGPSTIGTGCGARIPHEPADPPCAPDAQQIPPGTQCTESDPSPPEVRAVHVLPPSWAMSLPLVPTTTAVPGAPYTRRGPSTLAGTGDALHRP